MNRNNYPLISVVMATYNGEAFLEEQLDSLLSQDHENFELIICDDGSTDSTRDILQRYAASDNRIAVYLNETNLGANRNFEKGLSLAKGDFIAFADQDDVWRKDKLSTQLALFTDNEIVLVHSISRVFDGRIPKDATYSTTVKQMMGNDSRRLFLRNSISGHNMMFRKELVKYVVPLPAGIYYDWWIAVIATCVGKIGATNRILAFQRSHGGNITVKKRKTSKQTKEEFYERKRALDVFSSIPQMNPGHNKFLQQLREKLNTLGNQHFSFEYFSFLMKHRSLLFFYKTKMLPFFSHLKTAYRMSFAIEE